jgi:Bacteriophage Mu, GemA protein
MNAIPVKHSLKGFYMLNNNQIKLVQTAVRAAGLRDKTGDQRYRILLGNYKQPNGDVVTSCKQLNNWQLDDLLAICESLGWQYPGQRRAYYRNRSKTRGNTASFAQQSAIAYLSGDLGWNNKQLSGMVERQTAGRIEHAQQLRADEAHGLIEALKNILSRETGKDYKNLKEVQQDMEATDGADGKKQQTG